MQTLQQSFTETALHYTADKNLVDTLWAEIAKRHSGSKRKYHNLAHLQNMHAQLASIKLAIEDWDIIILSICYHDIVYNPLKKDNEEKSAALAGKTLREIQLPTNKITRCQRQILATKTHVTSLDEDTNLFTDADLSILGHPAEVYRTYCHQIRQEYAIYPDVIYNPGRKKVLVYFLQMPRIFKTEIFYDWYEQQARINLQQELDILST